MGKSESRIPAALQRLCRRLKRHRNSKGKGWRLPDGIWQSAAKLAREHGVSLVARVLSLDDYTMKEKVAEVSSKPSASPSFVEILPSPVNKPDSPLTIELRSCSGNQMLMRCRFFHDSLEATEGRTPTAAIRRAYKCSSLHAEKLRSQTLRLFSDCAEKNWPFAGLFQAGLVTLVTRLGKTDNLSVLPRIGCARCGEIVGRRVATPPTTSHLNSKKLFRFAPLAPMFLPRLR